MVEIYALCEPATGEIRYVGKAKKAVERFKRHLTERYMGRSVNKWVDRLLIGGHVPTLKVLAQVPDDQWEQAERYHIAEQRKVGRLLNLADGGARPSQTKEQRKKAAHASNAVQRNKHPAWREHVKAKQDLARLYANFSKQKKSPVSLSLAATLRFRMRIWAAEKPELYGAWANL